MALETRTPLSEVLPKVGSSQLGQKPLDPELFGCAALLGLAIIVAEGGYAGPLVASFLAIFVASIALMFWLIRTGTFLFPVGIGWLVALLMTGCLSAVVGLALGRAGNNNDLTRDLAVVLSYIGFLLVGCFYRRERGVAGLVWWVLIFVGGVISIIHIWLFVSELAAGTSNLYLLRLEAGRGSQAQLVAVIATCLVCRGRPPGDRWKKVAVATAVLCVVSITLTLSRVLLLQLIIVAMIFTATRVDDDFRTMHFRIGRAVTVVAGGIAALSFLLFSLQFVSEAAFDFVYEGFVEKLLNSWNEVASSEQQSLQDINENYRAFEAERGVESFQEAGWFGQWFGQGWGTAVQLGLDTASTRSDFVRTEAAFLHNGYVNYLVKVGILGVACYAAFMLRLIVLAIFQPVARKERVHGEWQRQALLAVVLCLAFATLTAGGFGFPTGFLSVALLIGTCLYTPARSLTYDGVRRKAH